MGTIKHITFKTKDCKREQCKKTFTVKHFLQKYCSKLCSVLDKPTKPKPTKQPVRNYRKTGMLVYFQEIWNERPHISEISGEPIHEFDIRCFSHVLPRSTYPLFATNKRNLILKTPDEHRIWQFSQHTIKGDPKWKFVFDLKLSLTQEYYKTFYNREF